MGITVIRKSDRRARKRDSRVALVLAGGAITGGAFKLGGLKALDDFLVERKTTDFDVHVGLSAGAFLAVPLAAGVTPAEMMQSLDGGSERFTGLRPADVYNPNLEELIQKPLRYLLDLGTFPARLAIDLVVAGSNPMNLARRVGATTLVESFARTAKDVLANRRFPVWLDYLPSAPFDNVTLERYLRDNMRRAGLPNDFPTLHERTGRDLRIVAMNLDSAERVVFGHDDNSSITISKAVQASTALPGFYRPVELDGGYYVDGGVQGTANVDVAIDRGAELIVCYNPFRPIRNDQGSSESLARRGFLPILNQVFRTMLHSRLQLGLQRYAEDSRFRGDIIVIEPAESDVEFFGIHPFAFWKRQWAASHGYASVTRSLSAHFEELRPIFQSYGIEVRRPVIPIDSAVLTEETRTTPHRSRDLAPRPVARTISSSVRGASAVYRSVGRTGCERKTLSARTRAGGWWKRS
jgi:predicted acylesterase/phospholipase RssA